MATVKRWIDAASAVLVVGFCAGVFFTLQTVMAHRYVEYGMYRMALAAAAQQLSKWVLLTAGGAVVVVPLVVIFLRPLLRLAGPVRGFIERHRGRCALIAAVGLTAVFAALMAADALWLIGDVPAVNYALGDLGVLVVLLSWLMAVRYRAEGRPSKVLRMAAACALVAAIAPWIVTGADKKMHPPGGPSVLFIIVDTLRADHMSCYGYGRKTTPCVDLFAKEATLFKNAIAAAPWTSASIGSMITGQYPAAIGIELFGSSLKESVRGMMGPRFVTLAELFRERNYTTRGIVSNVHIGSRMGFQQGYEAYEESDARAADYISSPSVTAKAIRFLKEHGGEKFFLFVHYFDPHYDYILHENYNYFPEYRGRFFSDQQHVDLLKRIPEVLPDDLRYITALYDSEISFTDEYIGRLLDTVRKLGLYDDLLIVFVADHGEEFLERGTIGHGGTLYQEQVHVPLIVKLPGQKEGRVIDEYVGLIDMMTSTAAWAGVAMPRGYEHDGEPIDAGNPASLRGREIVSETTHVDHPAESVTREGWKLVFDRKTSAQMLFDLAGDPGELANRTGDSEPERERLHSILRSWDEQIEPKRPKGKQRQPKFSEEQLKDLKSLGYIQ